MEIVENCVECRLRTSAFFCNLPVELLKEFESLTGCPVIINTSFNVRGEPIVCRPEEAYRCFLATDMDVLVLEDCVLHKEDQPESARPKVEEYLAQFKLD